MEKEKKFFSSNTIKVIAIIAMTLDHIAWKLFPGFSHEAIPIILHIIGRLTCPIMCYFIAEGYHNTKNINRYTTRLFLFALISHFAYAFASLGFADGGVLNRTSVMWSLAWGLVMLRVVNSPRIKNNATKIILVILCCIISFPSDWSCIASLCILAFGTNRGNFKAQMLWMIFCVSIYSVAYFFAVDKVYGLVQMSVVLTVPVLMMYNGQRGKNQTVNKVMKWLFYIYYPLHLFVIGFLNFA